MRRKLDHSWSIPEVFKNCFSRTLLRERTGGLPFKTIVFAGALVVGLFLTLSYLYVSHPLFYVHVVSAVFFGVILLAVIGVWFYVLFYSQSGERERIVTRDCEREAASYTSVAGQDASQQEGST